MSLLYGIAAIVFQFFNLIRHPTSYTAAVVLAVTSFLALCVSVYMQYRARRPRSPFSDWSA